MSSPRLQDHHGYPSAWSGPVPARPRVLIPPTACVLPTGAVAFRSCRGHRREVSAPRWRMEGKLGLQYSHVAINGAWPYMPAVAWRVLLGPCNTGKVSDMLRTPARASNVGYARPHLRRCCYPWPLDRTHSLSLKVFAFPTTHLLGIAQGTHPACPEVCLHPDP